MVSGRFGLKGGLSGRGVVMELGSSAGKRFHVDGGCRRDIGQRMDGCDDGLSTTWEEAWLDSALRATQDT